MQWASSASAQADLESAVAEASAAVSAALDGATPDLAVVFVSPHHAARYEAVPAAVAAGIGGGLILGCSAGGVIGGGREIEEQPGLSITAAVLPGVRLMPFHLVAEGLPEPDADDARWRDVFGIPATRTSPGWSGDPMSSVARETKRIPAGIFFRVEGSIRWATRTAS